MIGQTISHYKILEKLGEGGMGVVYKAQDTTLDRMVALKILPAHAPASDSDSSRFIQEAKAAAALNHPNICTIHGIDESEGRQFIVMEFVDGQMLQEKKATLSLKQAIDYGIQIAEGLSAAHEKGVVHRDIKPENIMVRKDGIVQVMDFGLAKLRGATRLTKEGSTVGTAGYMSPEQVQGQETDHRSDIFSLGVLLYEMITGHLPFKGIHETAVAYEIVNVDSPPMSSIKPEIPPELDAIVLECLEKDPKERTQSASQIALDLKRYRRESSRSRASRITVARLVRSDPSQSQTIPAPSPETLQDHGRPSLKMILLAAGIPLAAVAGYLLSLTFGVQPGTPFTVRATIEPPAGSQISNDFGGHLAISPDGTQLVFLAVDSLGSSRLWVRPLSAPEAKPLAGTEGASYPFWSPDGKEIAFFVNTKIRKVDLLGSPPLDIADVPQGRGGAWSPDGTIVLSPVIGQRNLFTVPSGGGELKQLTSFDSTYKFYPRYPSFLPDGKHFVYVGYAGGGAIAAVTAAFVGSLDGSVKELPVKGVSNLIYSSGHLLYLRQSTLIAQAFDPSSLEFTGDPVPLDKGVELYTARAKGNFTASPNEVIAYVRNLAGTEGHIAWLDRNGRPTDIVGATPEKGMVLSPDGARIAYSQPDDQGNEDIWTYDISRGIKTRFTFDPGADIFPRWTPDGRNIIYNTVRDNHWRVLRKLADGTGGEEVVTDANDTELWVSDVSPDGKSLLYSRQTLISGFDILSISLNRPGILDTILSTRFHEYGAVFSPDGKWLAYQSDASGRYEVYVRRFAQQSEKWQVSTGGGQFPVWFQSGEIAYANRDKEMIARVSFPGGVPKFSIPSELFPISGAADLSVFDATDDGRRILALRVKSAAGANSLSLIVNWRQMVERR